MPLCLIVSTIQLDLSLIVSIVAPLSSSVDCGDTGFFFLLNFGELFSHNNDMIRAWKLPLLYLVSNLSLPIGTNSRSEGGDVPASNSLYETY
jgi:hypothetical protein